RPPCSGFRALPERPAGRRTRRTARRRSRSLPIVEHASGSPASRGARHGADAGIIAIECQGPAVLSTPPAPGLFILRPAFTATLPHAPAPHRNFRRHPPHRLADRGRGRVAYFAARGQQAAGACRSATGLQTV